MQFRIDNFKFDGKYLSDFGFAVVNVSESTNTRKIGLTRSISTTEIADGYRVIDSISPTTQSFDIIISKLDSYGNPLSITRDDLEQLTTWLFMPTDYKEFIPLTEGDLRKKQITKIAISSNEDSVNEDDKYIIVNLFDRQPDENIRYYGIFTDGTQTYLNKMSQGYITLTLEIDSNHAYLDEIVNTYQVSGEKTITIESRGNIKEYCYPDIEFNVNGVSFTIENLTTGDKVQFSNLDSKSKNGIIYGDGIMTVISKTDATVNMREKSNKKFLRLKHGTNQIKITGDGTFTISFQPRISLR